jgi:acetoin utilization deacetylase AcuC-like enzyme
MHSTAAAAAAAAAAVVVAVIDDELFDLHVPDTKTPEKPYRTRSIRSALHEDEEVMNGVVWVTPAPYEFESRDTGPHKQRYVDELYIRCRKADIDGAYYPISADEDALVGPNSLAVIECAAGAARQAVALVLDTDCPIRRVFCNIRPPGHHAHVGNAQGFCFVNNVWIAACAARDLDVKRIAIVDWDLHHGNGTQEFILRSYDEEVSRNTLFFSIHQDYNTIWPGSGKDKTHGPHGTIHCKNMSEGAGDDEVKAYFRTKLVPTLRAFAPELILISCGFDAHKRDEHGSMFYSSELYGWMTRQLCLVDDVPIVSILEGGYDDQALRESSVHHVRALIMGEML